MFRVKMIDAFRRIDSHGMYLRYISDECIPAEKIVEYQENKRNAVLEFHIKNNAGYVEWLKSKGIDNPLKLKWEEIPIITKADLLKYDMVVKGETHHLHHTGGSTGHPLAYSLTKDCVSSLWAAIWRAFSVLDVKPCEALLMIAGTSLLNKETFQRKVYNWLNRFHTVSAFDLNDSTFAKVCQDINRKKIKVIYGYASSVLEFLRYLERNDRHIPMKGIFTTSEMLPPEVRKLAKKYCDCDVIDIYGANDGGILAFECKEHCGYHISWERSFVEIIDHKIILTDLFNTSFPFIRYQVEDMTSGDDLIYEKCKCGRTMFRLPDISGRIFDMVKDSDGNLVNSFYFIKLTSDDNTFSQIQAVEQNGALKVNFISDKRDVGYYKEKYAEAFKKRFNREIEIVLNDQIQVKKNGKTPIYVNLDKV